MAETDMDYFERRAREERLAAECATHPTARQAHLDLAERYEDMAAAVSKNVLYFETAVAARG